MRSPVRAFVSLATLASTVRASVQGRFLALSAVALISSACASTPAPLATALPAAPTPAQKMTAILEMEDRRVLEDSSLAPAAVKTLSALLADEEGRIRRRAALAAGRIGLPGAVAPLTDMLAGDVEPEVRAMAAFALGLIGDASAAPALVSALGHADARVHGRAAEALGLIGHAPAAGSIAGMVVAHVKAGALADVSSDAEVVTTTAAEAVRLGVFALTRLKAVEELRAVTLGADGLPHTDWWPFAFALQRVATPAVLPPLRTWLSRGGSTTRAFAVRGVGALKDAESRTTLEALASDPAQSLGVRVQAVRALAMIGDVRSAAALEPLVLTSPIAVLRLDAVGALGAVANAAAAEVLIDLLEDDWPSLRAASQAALAKADPDTFLTVMSGLDVDPEWRVRRALASTLGGLAKDAATLRLDQLSRDADPKVRSAALTSLVAVKASGVEARLLSALGDADPVVRLAAARGLGEVKPTAASAALVSAWQASAAESTYVARAGILAALVAVDPVAAGPLVRAALADRDWAVRVRAAALAKTLDAASSAAPERPAPLPDGALRDVAGMIAPAYSPEAYVRTTRGEFRIELAVADAPRTVSSFVALAGRGFFDGLAWHRVIPDFVAQGGDPRGDGEGGPGYTLRDELSTTPYLRGTVGLALDWADTGGSQFFVTLSPQPHLDARYPVIGKIVAGMDVVARLEPFDRIVSLRVWDGERWHGASK